MLVSIIMPVYNGEQFIEEALDSVLSQTFSDWELIIVDDCSSDNTNQIINKYKKKYEKIKSYKSIINKGPAEARNLAIQKAVGKYLAFLDADDIWHPNKLEVQINYMETNNINFCCHGYEYINKNGNSISKFTIPPQKINYKKCILLSNPIGNLTVVYNQEKLGKIYSPSIKRRNDFALWLQVLKKEEYCYGIPEIMAKHRVEVENSVSYSKTKMIKYHWELYHKIEKHNLLRSGFEMVCWFIVKGLNITKYRKND